MARIDDSTGKLREHFLESDDNPATKAAIEAGKFLIKPTHSIADIVIRVLELIASGRKDSTLRSFQVLMTEFYEALDKKVDDIEERINSTDYDELVAVALERIFWGANEQKVRRFAAVVTSAIARGVPGDVEDAAAYIRMLNELSEEDLRVLKLFYKYQKDLVLENHAMPHSIFFDGNRMTSLQEGMINMGMQIDDLYARCNRLVGYGLLLTLERSSVQGDINVRNFKMTLMGKRLITILLDVAGESSDTKKPDNR